MALYPTYTVAGEKMDDPWGRWELVHGSRVLPTFPGRRLSSWNVPGQPGDVSAAYAPGEAASFPLRFRINAIENSSGQYVSGGTEARLRVLQANLDLLYQKILLAKQGYQGMVEVRHYDQASSYRRVSARVISASELEWDAYSEYAYVTLIFEAPTGVWTAPAFDVTSMTITKAQTSFRIEVPAGTAPMIENMVCFNPGATDLLSAAPARLAASGGPHGGFRLGTQDTSVLLPANKWTMVNTLHWKYGFTTGASDWGTPKPYRGLIEPNGRPMGSALTLLPEGDSGKAYLWVWAPRADVQVRIRSRKAWF